MPEGENQKKICLKCQKSMVNEAMYCGRCGHSFLSEDRNVSLSESSNALWDWVAPAFSLWIILLALNGVFGLFASKFELYYPVLGLIAQGIAAIAIIAMCFSARKDILPLLTTLGYKGFNLLEIPAAWLFLLLFMNAYFFLASSLGIQFTSQTNTFPDHQWPLWSTVIMMSVLPPVLKELAFRGFIMTKLEKVGSTTEAILIQAAMFSILHLIPTVFISHFVIGIILGIIRLRSQSLYPCILLHAMWNGYVILSE